MRLFQEGYGLSWNPGSPGHLLSASDDQTVCLWDVQSNTAKGNELAAKTIFHAHASVRHSIHIDLSR